MRLGQKGRRQSSSRLIFRWVIVWRMGMLVSRMEARSVAAVSRAVSIVRVERFGNSERVFGIRGPRFAMLGYVLLFRRVCGKETSIRIS